ncbi:ABC transporter substrate-binding protein [Pelistega europaea]|uniref:ABC transporter substrate-binding protein n=1 Tax=Pelistega europaea TaxID=106147 RepID=A0A7Y4P3K7_9BURK|nr:ABC transporter substrate-binding protein [Pelistega europaea]NOL48556.1 ABC transporter substrate-binding protein [Pelistega europaea]
MYRQLVCALLGAAVSVGAYAKEVIKVGEINSYKTIPAFLDPYRKGIELAVEQVNAEGGIHGKTLEVIMRDDGGTQSNAIREAQTLVQRDKVDLLAGSFLSHIALAISDFAQKKNVFFLAGEPLTDKMTWEKGNENTFRLRDSTYMKVAMLIDDAVALKKKRWALVYPNYEYGQSAAETFKKMMKARQPDIEFVTEQATPFNKIDAGSVVQAIADAKPEAVFNALFSTDLTKFVRAGNTRELFKDIQVVSLLTGEPEYLDPLGADTPKGWIVTGYPWYAIHTPEHEAFLKSYQAKFNDYPRLGSLVGYMMVQSLAAGLKKAPSTKTEDLVAAFKGLEHMSPVGKITYRAIDHQSTMGAYVGRLDVKDGKGVMVDIRYIDGASVQPPDEEVRRLRPQQ